MRKPMKIAALSLAVLTIGICEAVAAGPAMNVGWADWSGDQDACVKRASDKMRNSGFTTRFEVINNRTIFGERGSYTAGIRCAAEKNVAFFVVSGPDTKECSKYNDLIKEGF